jgi:hypothetical protein
MKEIKPITPSEAGLSILVASGPRGSVKEDWQSIEYTVQIMLDKRPVWTGEYKLGIGHVKLPAGDGAGAQWGMTSDEKCMLAAWIARPHANFTNKQLQADVAAKLATKQKVAPKLDDVCHSLLMDGSAYFDGMRFEEWASDLGYSDDSIKAKETFETCDKIGRDLNRALKKETLAGLREWASNY